MKDSDKTKEQLINELEEMRQGITESEASEAECKNGEKEIKNAAEVWRVTFDSISDLVFIHDKDFKLVMANRAMANLVGEKPEDLIGRYCYQIFHGKEKPSPNCPHLRFMETGEPVTVELFEAHFDKYLEASVSPIFDEQGKFTSSVHVIRDITERKQAEEALKSEKAKLQTLVDGFAGTQIGIDIVGFDYKVQFQNEVLKARFGDPTGKLCYEHYMRLDKPCDPCPMREAIKTNRPESIELTAVDGRHYKLLSAILPNPDGTVDKAIEIVMDITERKRMEEELKQEHRLFTSGPTVVFKWIAADGWPIDYASPNAYGLLGYTSEELTDGRHLFGDMLHPDDLTRVVEQYKRAERQADCGQLASEYRILDKDGKIRWVHEHTMLIRDDVGQVKYNHGYVTDITDQKKAEAEKQEMERKAQVTSRLASVGEMASGIAHEINNPLTGVVGFSELLLQKDLPEDLREEMQIICDGSKRVADIVKRLLTFARQHKPERTCTDINQIIESTLTLRRYVLETGNIEVSTSLDAGLPCTMADTGQLQQVFMNIIVNAESEMKKAHGRGKLTIKTEQIDNKIRLSFKDDGPGIAKENIGKVFDPFFTTKEVGEGTGMGLSLSYGIISEHKGAMYVESEAGKGATFIIELPIVEEEEEKIERVEAVEEAGKAIGGRILVVDDEPTILAFLKEVLGGGGYDVETASSGKEALGMIKNKRYSLILCDIKLSGLSGAEIYDEIGKTAPSLQKRVMFITGDVIAADTGEFLKRTKVPYVTKPFDITGLKEEVKRVIAGAG